VSDGEGKREQEFASRTQAHCEPFHSASRPTPDGWELLGYARVSNSSIAAARDRRTGTRLIAMDGRHQTGAFDACASRWNLTKPDVGRCCPDGSADGNWWHICSVADSSLLGCRFAA